MPVHSAEQLARYLQSEDITLLHQMPHWLTGCMWLSMCRYSTPPQDDFWCCFSVCFIFLLTHMHSPSLSPPPPSLRGHSWPCWLHRASWVWSAAGRCHGGAAAAESTQPSPTTADTCQSWPYPQSHPHHAGPTAAGQHLLCPAESGQRWALEEKQRDR